MDTLYQETELHWHFQVHSAMWGMPNWSSWPEGDSYSAPDALLYAGCATCLSLNSFVFLWFWVLVFLWTFQEAMEHAQATGHVNFQEYRWCSRLIWKWYKFMCSLCWFEWASLV